MTLQGERWRWAGGAQRVGSRCRRSVSRPTGPGRPRWGVLNRETPFVVFRDLESALEPALFRSVEIASRALGAPFFIDLYSLKQEVGVALADEELKRRVERLLAQD